MVRTKADSAGLRVASAKAPRKNFGGTSRSSNVDLGSPASKKERYSGGNSVCPRETPNWQKPINSFFTVPAVTKENTEKENLQPENHDKENRPKETSKKIHPKDDCQPGGSGISKKKKIVTRVISDSESDGDESVTPCVAKMDDAITED